TAYRLQRQAEFLVLERVPPATDGKTLVAPPTDLKGRIESLVGLSKWDVLIDTAEGAMRGDALFWLDLHWHVVQALRALGASYDDARKAVAQEIGHLLQRLPGLETLKFRDDTPFAEPRTQSWIDAECRVSGGAPAAQARPLVAPEGTSRDVLAEIETELAAAQTLAGDGAAGATEALAHLAQKTRTTDSRREKFLWRLAQARLLSAIDRHDIARAQLELLDEELARLPVAEWDLAVTVEVVRTLYECHRKWMQKQQKPTPEAAERLRALYERLARLDPAVAIGAGSGV